MAIIQPLKKIFNWQTASEKIPYKVYTAYITVDDSENMYAFKVFENTIGAVTFETVGIGEWFIKLPYSVPRINIVIPGFGEAYNANNGMISTNGTEGGNSFTIYPGFGVDGGICSDAETCNTNHVDLFLYDTAGPAPLPWRTFFASGPTGPTTKYPIEIRVYN